MNIMRSTLVFALMLCFSACALTAANANTEMVPQWAVDNHRDGYVTGLGIGKLKPAKKNAERFRDKTALLMAEANLAKQFEIHIKSNTYVKSGSDNDHGVRVDTVQTSITTGMGQLQKVELERWINPSNGTLYLLLGIKVEE